MIRKALLTTALTAGMLAGSAGVASAHECFIAKRSDAGSVGAANSANWEVLETRHLFADAHLFLSPPDGPLLPALTPAQVTEAVAMAEEAGIPSTMAIFIQKTIPVGKAGTAKTQDGKGIDHLDGYFPTFASIYFQLAGPAGA